MATISVSGSMYEFNCIEISDEDLQRLLDAKVSDDDFWENLEDIHDEIMGDSRINGFAYALGDPKPGVYVDGDEIEVDCDDTESEAPPKPVILKSHYLVYEQWSKGGELTADIDDEFDPDEFSLGIDWESLPNGVTRKVLNPSYGDSDFEFQGSSPSYEDLYILKSDGTRIDL